MTKRQIKTWLISSHLDRKSFVNNDLLYTIKKQTKKKTKKKNPEYSTRADGTFTLLRCLANTTTLTDAVSSG